jgi:radical SAM family uncharacterized protein/radical SAM-linked protein
MDLSLINKPSRYIGNEINSIRKDLNKVALKIALVFPDVYEVGMSHLGIHILYHILNSREDIAAERVYAPWVDLESILRSNNILLKSIESSIPLKEFDIVGFTLQYELSYTNILNILDLSGIPLCSKDRDSNFPLIIGGGPCAFNPEPLADFFDLFVIGDGEEIIIEISDIIIEWKRKKSRNKKKLLEKLSELEGVYVPILFNPDYDKYGRIRSITPNKKISKRVVKNLNSIPYPISPIIPYTNIIHDRLNIEIARGCTTGCRFCQAGFIYRPLRERSIKNLIDIIDVSLKNSGYEEISLLSLSSGDYRCIKELIKNVMNRYSDKKIALSLPSLKVDAVDNEILLDILRVRKTGFTLAVEAGSERLRRVINKKYNEDDLLKRVSNIAKWGWRSIKLYFMIGLPTEDMDDINGIIDISKKILKAARQKININLHITAFVPKAHTPFQWREQIEIDDIYKKIRYIKRGLSKTNIDIKWQDPFSSLLEGVFARGDRRLSTVLLKAFKSGCHFDGWREYLNRDLWVKAFEESGIEMKFYIRNREYGEAFPWDHINPLVKKDFLISEDKKALEGESTPDCRFNNCLDCGVCDGYNLKNIISENECGITGVKRGYRNSNVKRRIQLKFSKLDLMRYISHLELLNLMHRAVRRAQVPIRFSQGFHPLPRIMFGPPLPVGIESISEYVELEIYGSIKIGELIRNLNKELPHGLEILEGREVSLRSKSLTESISKFLYKVSIKEKDIESILNDIKRIYIIYKGDKPMDIKNLLEDIYISGGSLYMTIKVSKNGWISPIHILKELGLEPQSYNILKMGTIFYGK